MALPIERMIDKVVTPNEPPTDLKEGQVWATHSGVLNFGEFELTCHVLSNGMRIFDKESIDKIFPGFYELANTKK